MDIKERKPNEIEHIIHCHFTGSQRRLTRVAAWPVDFTGEIPGRNHLGVVSGRNVFLRFYLLI